ncbi:MAG: ribbon-helix-helix protein, CopG family [Thermoanaerobaculia bacterium]
MKTISVAILEPDYEAFRQAAQKEGRPIAQLIREAMAFYRHERLEVNPRLTDLPVLPGPRPRRGIPSRAVIYDEIYDERFGS